MTPEFHYFYIARFVLEAQSAFAINSGFSDSAFDSLVVRDANGLPTIPGTSLAGVLRRSFYQACQDDQADMLTNALFGYTENYSISGAPSRVNVSWGHIHDENDKPIQGRIQKDDIEKDVLLNRLQVDHPIHRERVSIDHRGVAKDKSKFDVTLIPKGCRFGFELSFWSADKQDENWGRILEILSGPIHIGSQVRNGLGRFSLQRLHQRCFDLKDQNDYESFKKLGTVLNNKDELEELTQLTTAMPDLTLILDAEDFWQFGHQGEALQSHKQGSLSSTQLTEIVIDWRDNEGRFSKKKILVPGSSIKGAIAHRTVFHYNRLVGNFIGPDSCADNDYYNDSPIKNTLFGAAGNYEGKQQTGKPGVVSFSDCYLEYDSQSTVDAKLEINRMTHNSIDRFTGGTRKGMLFTEELVWGKKLNNGLKILLHFDQSKSIDKTMRKAFLMAIDDLLTGRLALGAGSNKGHGYFSGKKLWANGVKKWFEEGIENE